MTAAERAREEGRRAGLLDGAAILEGRTAISPVYAEGARLLRVAAGGLTQVRLDGSEEPAAAGAQEVTARVLIVLQAHLVAREKFFKEERGVYQPPSAAAQEEARKEVRAALIRHHETNGDREKWRKTSAVLAAGIGILYSEPHNGEMEKDKKDHELSRGQKLETGWLPRLYLEIWRPWKLQRGKPDPVPGFAELCFASRRESGGGK